MCLGIYKCTKRKMISIFLTIIIFNWWWVFVSFEIEIHINKKLVSSLCTANNELAFYLPTVCSGLCTYAEINLTRIIVQRTSISLIFVSQWISMGAYILVALYVASWLKAKSYYYSFSADSSCKIISRNLSSS